MSPNLVVRIYTLPLDTCAFLCYSIIRQYENAQLEATVNKQTNVIRNISLPPSDDAVLRALSALDGDSGYSAVIRKLLRQAAEQKVNQLEATDDADVEIS